MDHGGQPALGKGKLASQLVGLGTNSEGERVFSGEGGWIELEAAGI